MRLDLFTSFFMVVLYKFYVGDRPHSQRPPAVITWGAFCLDLRHCRGTVGLALLSLLTVWRHGLMINSAYVVLPARCAGPSGAEGPSSSAVNCTVRQVAVRLSSVENQAEQHSLHDDRRSEGVWSRLCKEVVYIGSRTVKHRSVLEDVRQARDITTTGGRH